MRFLNIINKKADILSHFDPDRIYVENIRSFFNLPSPLARFYCEMAVKQKIFRKKYGILCQNDDCRRLIKSVNNPSEIPATIKCDHCELLERDNFEFQVQKKDIIEFYQLINRK